MKKEHISKVLIGILNSVDNAGLDQLFKEALENCPIKIQKKFIQTIIQYGEEDNIIDKECWNDWINDAKEIVEG